MKTGAITKDQLSRSVRLGGFALVLIGGIALALTQRMLFSALILICAALIAWLAYGRAARGNFWEIASFCYLLFFFFDLFRVSQALAPALVHLFIFIQINKMFNLQAPRDYYQLYLLTFLTILAASSLSVEIEMFYVIIVYILLLVWNIVSLTLYQEWRKEESASFPFSLFSPQYCFLILMTGVLTFAAALTIFFILPRMQLGYFGEFSAGKVQHVTGFSQKVNLGDITSIQEDPTKAMRVRVTPDNPARTGPYYWRGIAFDHYDGRSWSNGYPGNRFLTQDSNGFVVSQHGELSQLILQEFYMEPLNTRIIFGMDRVVRVKGGFGEVSRDPNGTLTGMTRVETYQTYSRAPHYSPEQLRNSNPEIPAHIARYYLQLPFSIPRVTELAESITAEKSTNFEKVIAIERYLQKNYKYTMTDFPFNLRDPISEFLFEKKSGHCEYFASGMVILLRTIGIPARLVNGFLEGEYNEIGGFYLVRNSDAHSWVEVYFNGQWIPFDPSPRPELAAGAGAAGFFSIKKIMESIAFFWDRYILIFSAQDQIETLDSIRDRYREMKSRARTLHWPDPILVWEKWARMNRLNLVLFFGLIALSAAIIRFWTVYRKTIKMSRTPILFYREMLSILEKNGYRRELHQTPAEFVERLNEQMPLPLQKDLNLITELFYKARFGSYKLTATDQSEVRSSLERLQNMNKAVPSTA
jgi:transglutaminase-like putative cysteine protease